MGELAGAWLADVQLRTDLVAGIKDLYRRELESLVLSTFSGFRLREMTTGRVDRFLREQAVASYARARRAAGCSVFPAWLLDDSPLRVWVRAWSRWWSWGS